MLIITFTTFQLSLEVNQSLCSSYDETFSPAFPPEPNCEWHRNNNSFSLFLLIHSRAFHLFDVIRTWTYCHLGELVYGPLIILDQTSFLITYFGIFYSKLNNLIFTLISHRYNQATTSIKMTLPINITMQSS